MDSDSAFWKDFDATQVSSMKEMCIAVDEDDNTLGAMSKKDCHLMVNIDKGLVHRAFSVLLFNEKNEFLLTQRSDEKITFPGYYTNACCSHPLYTDLEIETKDAIGVKRAAQRRLETELGVEPFEVPLTDMQYLTRILYKAPSSSIWGEAEVDYILVIRKNLTLKPNVNEVKHVQYFSQNELKQFLDKDVKVSPWFRILANTFLYKWWDNLDDLSKFTDHNKIHKLI
ncbi:hypothetical protein B4U80_10358 [Leptotrombidium deliense]|uniref:isopentenyl-diphosphate Delta-isomerase n=1 Tax=Leptotrombidium deliense TaxID=299467 RepID=A0A443S539_9ACAR|nr:hypothetical protein B4U80_10358 [Leptotrombidium deliense]